MKAPRDSYAIALLSFNLGARYARARACVCVCVCVGVRVRVRVRVCSTQRPDRCTSRNDAVPIG